MNWIRQEHSNGCGVAALAMLLDESYAEVASRYPMFPELDRPTGAEMIAEMERRGYRWRCVSSRDQTGGTWPPPPFAERHLACVDNKVVGHWVVMAEDGTVFDPLTPQSCFLHKWDVVFTVHGFDRD